MSPLRPRRLAARTTGESGDRDGITRFLLSPEAGGIRIERSLLVDSRNAARVRLDGVAVEPDAVLGEVGAETLDLVAGVERQRLCPVRADADRHRS